MLGEPSDAHGDLGLPAGEAKTIRSVPVIDPVRRMLQVPLKVFSVLFS